MDAERISKESMLSAHLDDDDDDDDDVWMVSHETSLILEHFSIILADFVNATIWIVFYQVPQIHQHP